MNMPKLSCQGVKAAWMEELGAKIRITKDDQAIFEIGTSHVRLGKFGLVLHSKSSFYYILFLSHSSIGFELANQQWFTSFSSLRSNTK